MSSLMTTSKLRVPPQRGLLPSHSHAQMIRAAPSRCPASARPTNNRLLTNCRASTPTSSPSLVNFLHTSGPSAPPRGAPTVSPMPLLFPALIITGAALYAGVIGAGMDPGLKMLAVAAPAILMQALFPAADALLGPRLPSLSPSPSTPTPTSLPLESITPTLTCLAHITACLCLYTAAATAPLDLPLLAVLTYSTSLSGVISIAACHELVHSRSRLYQAASEVFLAWTWWHPYSRQHLYHHLTMCTPDDFTTAIKGVNVFQFAPMYVGTSYAKSWQLSCAECTKAGKPILSHHNKALTGLLAQLGFTAAVAAALGPAAALLHLIVSVNDLFLMAVFDYVLHYGLSRPPLSGSPGRLAPVTTLNSWNSLYPLENAVLFNVAMHSDHHITASKSYPTLDPKEGTPLLPGPIQAVALASLVPPLFMALMDPRVDEVNARNLQMLEPGSQGDRLTAALVPGL